MPKSKRADVKFVCGVNGCKDELRGRTTAEARRNMDSHRKSAHPGYVPPRGSKMDSVPKLD